jgi:hypothetical protein
MYYQELTEKVFLVQAPWALTKVFGVISHLLPQRTRDKVTHHNICQLFFSFFFLRSATCDLPPLTFVQRKRLKLTLTTQIQGESCSMV